MQSKTSKNNTETPVACLGLQDTGACYTATVPQTPPRPEVHPVSQIARGLCENLRNVQKHRLLMQEEIKNVLKNLMFGADSKAMPSAPTGTPKEK
jgi:hypothetical protein